MNRAMETVFSGIQPTGDLHLGNYLGAVRNWVSLQNAEVADGPDGPSGRAAHDHDHDYAYDCFYCIVDYHAITQPYAVEELPRRARRMAIDVLACGIDPERSTLFLQSAVPEHTELAWILASVTPYGDLTRMTQFKDKSEHHPEAVNAGIFTYPILQAADILLYGATRVPVGEDQRQHLELAREIVRRFNARFGETFAEPQPLLSTTPKILGLDGQAKMSKSLGNTIGVRETGPGLWEKLRTAATDPARARRTDPGNPLVCNVYTLHRFFSSEERQAEVRAGCTTAGIGCIDCKKWLLAGIERDLTAIRGRAEALEKDPAEVDRILAAGAARARARAVATMQTVRARLGLLGAVGGA